LQHQHSRPDDHDLPATCRFNRDFAGEGCRTITDKKTPQYVQVFVDGSKKLQQNNTKQINTSIAVAKGAHTLTIQAKDNSGTFSKSVVFTVN